MKIDIYKINQIIIQIYITLWRMNKLNPSQEQFNQQKENEIIKISDQKFYGFKKGNLSYLFLLVSCMFFVSGFIYVNEMNMSPFQTTLSRSTILIFVSYIHCRVNKSKLVFSNRPFELTLYFRSIVIAVHGFIVALMQFYLPLSLFHTLNISGQIFIFLLNYLIMGIKISNSQIISSLISFIGLILVINGQLIKEYFVPQSKQFVSDFQNYQTMDAFIQLKMGLLYVAWTIVWAASIVVTKMPNYHGCQLLFMQAVISIFASTFGYFFIANDIVQPTTYIYSLFWCGIFMCIANYLFTYGILWGQNTGITTMMTMINSVFGYLYSIFRYNQAVNYFSLSGTAILVTSVGHVIYQQQKQKKVQISNNSHK